MKIKSNELEKDNWLQEQLRLENSVSFWDLDDGKKLRREHEEDCDARDVALTHHRRHLQRENVNYSFSNEKKKASSMWLAACVLLFIGMVSLSDIIDTDFHYMVIGLSIMTFSPVILFSYIFFRRFPSNNYWRVLFFIMLILELLAICEKFIRFF